MRVGKFDSYIPSLSHYLLGMKEMVLGYFQPRNVELYSPWFAKCLEKPSAFGYLGPATSAMEKCCRSLN